MKKAARDEACWLPRPGSWEEAVDPYDVQWARLLKQDISTAPAELPVEALATPRPAQRYHPTLYKTVSR